MASADLLIGAVLIPGARAPTVVSRQMVKSMRPGSAIVDIAIDQGGCIETIRPTSHEKPTYLTHGIVHYAVLNMPALVGRTSTMGLTQATEPYLAMLVEKGIGESARRKQGPRRRREHARWADHLRCRGEGAGVLRITPQKSGSVSGTAFR